MTCPPEEVLAAWADGEVKREERERLSQHIQQCGSCANRVDHLRALAHHLRGLEFARPGPGFTAELESKLQQRAPRASLATRVAASVVGLGAVALAAVLMQNQPDQPETLSGTFVARGADPTDSARVGFEAYAHEPGREPVRLRDRQSLAADTGYSFVAINRSKRFKYLMLFALDAQREVHWFYPAFTEPAENPRSIPISAVPAHAYALPEGITPDAPALGVIRFVGVFSAAPLFVREVEGLLRAGDLAALARAHPTAVIQVLQAELLGGTDAMIRAVGFLLLLGLSTPVTALADVASFALIVTNNRTQSTSRPDLHYADDDGVQYAALFGELIGPENVTLLTQLDAETAVLWPGVSPLAPTRANLNEAVRLLAARLAQARAAGAQPVVYLVFAGHGDLDRGQGYLDLADARLTARALDEHVITPLAADRVHLILDSCNSYFLLSPRKPGGKRWATDAGVPRDLLAKHPQLGVLLSTSAEAVTYEWSELQSGVFSYEVRAGLRGAADVNSDGRISYAELAGFIRIANRALVNDLYRPKVFWRPPRVDANQPEALIVQLPVAGGRSLRLAAPENLRLTVRDPQGVRVMDVNKEAGTPLRLRLPPGLALEAQQRISGEDRPRYVIRDLPEGDPQFELLPERPPDRASRGDAPLFHQLFAEPFGERAFERVLAEFKLPEAPPSGVTRRDYERLRLHLASSASSAETLRFTLGITWLTFTVIPIAALSYSVYNESSHKDGWAEQTGFWTGVAISLSLLSWSVYMLAVPSPDEVAYDTFMAQDSSSEAARARLTLEYERKLKQLAESSKSARQIGGWLSLAAGFIPAVAGVVILVEDAARNDPIRLQGPLNLAIGLGQMAFGAYLIGWATGSLENAWETYSKDPAVVQRGVE